MSPLAVVGVGWAREQAEQWKPSWYPWGPFGLPPCLEKFDDPDAEQCEEEETMVRRSPGIRRTRSWGGYALYQDQQLQPAEIQPTHVGKAPNVQPVDIVAGYGKELGFLSDNDLAGRPTTSTCAGESDDDADNDAIAEDILCEGSFGPKKAFVPPDDRHFNKIPKPCPPNENVILPQGAGFEQKVATTTLMIQNLPRKVTRDRLMAEMGNSGFAHLYDFCYLPRTFSTCCNRGFAFVNFVSEQAAESFAAMWQQSRRFGMKASSKPLSVTKAEIQGFQANAKMAASKKMGRVKNDAFRPLLVTREPTQ